MRTTMRQDQRQPSGIYTRYYIFYSLYYTILFMQEVLTRYFLYTMDKDFFDI